MTDILIFTVIAVSPGQSRESLTRIGLTYGLWATCRDSSVQRIARDRDTPKISSSDL